MKHSVTHGKENEVEMKNQSASPIKMRHKEPMVTVLSADGEKCRC